MPAPSGATPLTAAAYLSVTLFLLTADHAFLWAGNVKLKIGYFLILGLWLFAPRDMYRAAIEGLRRVPKYALLVLIPAAIAVATSVNPVKSVLWALWLGFDLFAIVTVYAFLAAQRFTAERVQMAAAGSLGLMALFGLVQFIAIFLLGIALFDPQVHLGMYRLNGVSGWPHFLSIFAFLLLPIVLTGTRFPAAVALIVVLLAFVLVESTAKTAWVLFAALVVLLLIFNRMALRKRIVLVAIPVIAAALLLPVPAINEGGPATTGAERLLRFGSNIAQTKSVRDRMLINRMGLAVFVKHPWFGVGPRAYDTYVFTRFDQELPGVNKLDFEGEVNAKNENIWIEFLAEAGVLFTLGFFAVLVAVLWVPRFRFANSLHLGAWMALVLYFAISGMVSQTGLLTLVYAVMGIYFYARSLPPDLPPTGTETR